MSRITQSIPIMTRPFIKSIKRWRTRSNVQYLAANSGPIDTWICTKPWGRLKGGRSGSRATVARTRAFLIGTCGDQHSFGIRKPICNLFLSRRQWAPPRNPDRLLTGKDGLADKKSKFTEQQIALRLSRRKVARRLPKCAGRWVLPNRHSMGAIGLNSFLGCYNLNCSALRHARPIAILKPPRQRGVCRA